MSHETGPVEVACTSIDEVVTRLENVVADCVARGDRNGLFASLYRQVTVQIRAGIAAGRFEDGPRMSRFDAHFGNRYLEARSGYGPGPCPQSWIVAFDFAAQPTGAIVQHLVLGINAHINLDLAVAAARTAPGASLPALHHDYLVVNDILVDTVQRIQDRLNDVSPVMLELDRAGWLIDETLMGWTIVSARAAAWRAAEDLVREPDEHRWEELVGRLDATTARLARRVCRPPVLGGFLERVRRRETHDVAEAIAVLDSAV